MSHPRGVANVQRRTWDLSEFEAKAKERIALEDFLPSANAPLTTGIAPDAKAISSRDAAILAQQRVGSHVMLDSVAPSASSSSSVPVSSAAGFYCEICQCTLKDNMAFFDHLNGRQHLKLLGLSIRSVRADSSQVLDRLEFHRRRVWISKCRSDEEKQALIDEFQSIDQIKEDQAMESGIALVGRMRIYGGHEILPFPAPVDESLWPPGIPNQESMEGGGDADIRVKSEPRDDDVMDDATEEELRMQELMGFSSFSSGHKAVD